MELTAWTLGSLTLATRAPGVAAVVPDVDASAGSSTKVKRRSVAPAGLSTDVAQAASRVGPSHLPASSSSDSETSGQEAG